jgi:hypothetical protein
MNIEGRRASRCRTLLLSGALAVALAAGVGSTAVAKGGDLPLNVRIVGAGGQRPIEFVQSGDLDGAMAFNNQAADLEQLADWLVFGTGRPGRPAPGLSSLYEIDFTPPLAGGQFPWNGMRIPHFYFYPAHGVTAAYVRLHLTRGSQPPVDGWLLARPEFTDLVATHLNGLAAIDSAPRSPADPVGWWWLGPVLLLAGAGVVWLRRIGYFMPVVAMPRTK